jgi:hypothetical protein
MPDGPEGRTDLDNITVTMDLGRLGELIAAVATKFAEQRGIDPPDYEGQEMRDLAVAGWHHVEFMADRVKFAQSVANDLAALEEPEVAPMPAHRPEFGFFDPPV